MSFIKVDSYVRSVATERGGSKGDNLRTKQGPPASNIKDIGFYG